MSSNEESFLKYVPSTVGGDKNPLRNVPGCYCILHQETGSVYVGSTKSLADRSSKNVSALKHNQHKNKPLQELYNKNNEVEIFVEPTTTVEEAQKLEQTVVDYFKDSDLLCNIAINDVTKTAQGRQLSDEIKNKIAESNRGQKRSDESRQKMSEVHLGQKLTQDHRDKLSTIHKDRLSTPDGKAAHARGIEKLSDPVSCNGVRYPSKSEAARSLGVDVTTILYRIKSPNFPNYFKE